MVVADEFDGTERRRSARTEPLGMCWLVSASAESSQEGHSPQRASQTVGQATQWPHGRDDAELRVRLPGSAAEGKVARRDDCRHPGQHSFQQTDNEYCIFFIKLPAIVPAIRANSGLDKAAQS